MKPSRRTLQLAERKLLLVVIDLALLSLSVVLALAMWARWDVPRFDRAPWMEEPQWLLLPVLWVAIGTVTRCYDLGLAGDAAKAVRTIILAAAVVLLIYAVVYFFAPRQSLPRSAVLVQISVAVVLLVIWRTGYAYFFTRAGFLRRALVVGAGAAGRAAVGLMQREGASMYSVTGLVDDDDTKKGASVLGVPILGPAKGVADVALGEQVSEVVVAITRDIHPDVLGGLLRLQEQGIQITPLPLLHESLTGRVPVTHIGDSWYVALPLEHRQTRVGYSILKRTFDIAVACFGLIVFVLILPFIALAIRLDSKGPVFYRQRRLGRRGDLFNLLKLRTMSSDAEPDGRAVWAAVKDPRITRVGRLLRSSMLDEMPQLWNVLKGEMSIVGPRPERPELVAELEKEIPYYRLRHAANPGMAGWALLHQGYTGSAENSLAKIEYDLYYIKHQSLWLDLQIILRTIGRGLTFRRSEARIGRSPMTLD